VDKTPHVYVKYCKKQGDWAEHGVPPLGTGVAGGKATSQVHIASMNLALAGNMAGVSDAYALKFALIAFVVIIVVVVVVAVVVIV
jgi:hypothetical protein